MGVDWFINAKCPRSDKIIYNNKESTYSCIKCPNVIWDRPKPVAGFMYSMCGVRVGDAESAEELDQIVEMLSGFKNFTKINCNTKFKIGILRHVRSYLRNTNQCIKGLTNEEVLKHTDSLIEFCEKATTKGLDVWIWA